MTRGQRLPGWLCSLLLVFGLHLGLGYWAWGWQSPLPAAAATPAALLIELAPAPPITPAAPSQQPARPAERKIVEAPKPRLLLPAAKPQPARATARPQPPSPPQPAAPAHSPATAAPAAPAAQTAASQPSQAVPSWQSELFSHLSRHKRYPEAARRRDTGKQRICQLRFTLDAQGKVLEYALVASSGNRLLDRATLELIRRAQPLPAPPAELLKNGSLQIVVPIVYQLRG